MKSLKILAVHRLAAVMQNVASADLDSPVSVSMNTLVIPMRVVDPNAWATLSVPPTAPVYARNVLILVREPAASKQFALSIITYQYVHVPAVTLAMPLYNVLRLLYKKYPWKNRILATQHHVVKTQFVGYRVSRPYANVYPASLAMLMDKNADQNVPLARTVPRTKHVSTTNVLIPVRVFAVTVLCVKQSTIILFAAVLHRWWVIHSWSATKHPNNWNL